MIEARGMPRLGYVAHSIKIPATSRRNSIAPTILSTASKGLWAEQ